MGMDARLAQIPDLIETQIAEQFGEAPADPAHDARLLALRRAVAIDSLRADATSAFATLLRPGQADSLLAELRAHPLAPVLERLHTPLDEALFAAMDAWANDLAEPPAPDRIRRYADLDNALGGSATDAMVLVNLYLGFVRVMEAHLPESERVAEADIPEIASLMYDELAQAYQAAHVGRLAYLLRDEPDATVDALAAWLATPVGQTYATLPGGILEQVLDRIGTRLDP
jgi:hypothetical protein